MVIQISEYSEIDIPNAWTGNRNPVAYTEVDSFEVKHHFDISKLSWELFPVNEVPQQASIKALTMDEAKNGIAKTLGIDPSCIEIQIKA